jgi:hypothetical protein
MAHFTAFEETINEIVEENTRIDLPELDEIDESLTILDECLEMLDAYSDVSFYELQYKCAEALAFEGERWERFKSAVKECFLKIINAVKKIIGFVIKIITWPFRITIKLLIRKKTKDADRAVAFRHEGLTIETSLTAKCVQEIKEIKKEQNKITNVIILDLKKISKYIKKAEKLTDECMQKTFNINGTTATLDSMSKIIEKKLTELRKTAKEKYITIHAALLAQEENDQAKMNMKGKDIFNILNQIGGMLETNTDTSTAKIESLLTSVSDELTKFEIKITSAKDEYVNNIAYEYEHTIHHMLSLTQAYIIDLASINIDIGKYFLSIDQEIHNIDKIAGYVLNSYTDKQIVDTIGGINIVEDDLFIAHDRGEGLVTDAGGACCIKKKRSYADSLRFTDDNYEIITRRDASDTATITISTGVAKLKMSKNPKEVKWYYHLIERKYGPHIADEAASGRIGNKISDMTEEEYAELKIWQIKEYKRLRKVYANYLKSHGQ